MISDSEIVDGLRSGSESQREVIFRHLYLNWQKKAGMISYLRSKGLTTAQCNDIYKDALIAFERAVVRQKYNPEKSTIDGYIFGTCRFLWIRRLKGQKAKVEETKEASDIDESFIKDLFDRELSSILDQIVNLLTPRCTQVIRLWSRGFSMKEIAEKMNYQSDLVARKSKCQCINSLYKLLEQKPQLKNQLKNWL